MALYIEFFDVKAAEMKVLMIHSIFRFCRYSTIPFIAVVLAGASSAMARECLDCHGDLLRQMSGNSHHVQGTAVSGKHCYACHWEATANGEINQRYHQGAPAAKVDLVVWSEGKRPTVYTQGSTVVTFQNTAIGTPREREEVARITSHCLACHSDRNNDISPFDGDSRTPRQYAWDRQSVAARYSQKGVTTWGKYSTATTNKKQRVTKAFSAHGNASANLGGWSAANGYDGDIPVTRGGAGARDVECFDCHNSHGSTVSGVTSSYRTFDGTFNGAILKETIAGKGGYGMSYKPSLNSHTQSKNPFNSGAGLCFDCHETTTAGTTPWGYNSTFGASQPIMGYKDTMRFGPGSKGSTARFSGRKVRTDIASSHLKAGKPMEHAAGAQINGLCTPCHDPHGVSPTLGNKMAYAVPLLKGAWLTSPYLEDGPPSTSPGKTSPSGSQANPLEITGANRVNRTAGNPPGAGGSSSPREPISRAGVKYNIDRNTFSGNSRIVENDETFGGICLNCHSKEKLGGDTRSGKIHRSVKGWGNNKEHSFPCSKCHQAHNSGLPRLMQTNCFEVGPTDLRESSGLPWLPEKTDPGKNLKKQEQPQQNDAATKNKTSKKVTIVGCHVKQFGKGSSSPTKQDNNQWEKKSSW